MAWRENDAVTMSAFDRLGQLHDLASEEIWSPSRLTAEVRRRVRVVVRKNSIRALGLSAGLIAVA